MISGSLRQVLNQTGITEVANAFNNKSHSVW